MTVSAATDAAINHGNGFFDFKALRKFKKLQSLKFGPTNKSVLGREKRGEFSCDFLPCDDYPFLTLQYLNSDLQVSDPIVSAVHCRFYAVRLIFTKEIQGDDWLIYCEDLSKNGTFFNKRRMGKEQNIILLDGCTIHLNRVYAGYTFVQSYPPTSHTEKMYPVNLDNEYKLTEKRLGYGSQTKIVLAAAIDHDTKQFACKIINIKSLVKELAEKVKIQLAIIRHVQHPCILRAIKVNLLSEDNAFVIMPIYQGGTLQDFVLQRQRLPENEARFIFYQLIRGIIYLHGQQIIHRDLKPENIFLARDKQFPRIVIADFGLATWTTETSFLSEDVGTLAYSAPELVEGKQYNAQIDDWSIGATLYFLLTSKHAFALDGAEDEDTQKLVLSGNYDTNNPVWPEVSGEGGFDIDYGCMPFDLEEDEKWLLTEEKLLEQQNQMPSIPAESHINARLAYKAVTSHEPIGLSKSHLTPVMSLPPNFRPLFPYTHFNRFQSECIDEVYRADENLVVSAPTGSGKTVLLELAILRTLHQEGCHKAIYIAPTKALSSQRANDWIRKFSHLNLTCQELTGDTEYVSFEYIKKCDIIVTTPEKWDSMTRRWTEHRKLMNQMTLCLIDEVHLVGQTRGATLEACISRMKMAVSNQRIIALSATVPNIQDVARWLNAKPLCFGEEYRPVKLSRHVYGIHDSGGNPFMFEKKLEWKLVDMIQKHSGGKPTLIFCSTRKSTQSSCDVIIKVMKQRNIPFFGNVLKPVPKTKDKKLSEYLAYGISFHHATTSTLSVGVNLPAHLVIIKSTRGYAEGKFQEYSDLEVFQMIGRAGRPGFDDSGCAVILTTTTQQRKYETMLSGQKVLESTLHQNMIEHLNAEICLGTICDTPSGISWLRSTFLYVRVQKNSFYYKLGEDAASVVNVERILENICLKHLSALASSNIIQMKPDEDQISSTKYGEAMARYYIKYDTMKTILSSQPQLQLASMFELLTSAREFDDIRFATGEKSVLNNLNKHPNIRYPIKGKVSTTSDKIYLLMQAILGGIPLNDSKLAAVHSREIFRIHHQALRVLRSRCITAKTWHNSGHLLQQLEGIGPQYAKILADSGIQTFGGLKSCDPRRLEMLLHRNPPFGSQLLEATNKIPQFKLSAKPSLQSYQRQGGQCKSIEAFIEIVHQSSKRPVYSNNSFAAFWATTNLDELLDYRRIQLRKLEKLVTIPIDLPEGWHPTTIKCSVDNEEYVGHGAEFTLVINQTSINRSDKVLDNPGTIPSTKNYLLDDEFDFDSPYWNNIPDELWEGLNVEASASSTQLNKSNPKRLSQFHDGARETCQHKCKDRQLCAHVCCKIGKRRKGKSAISKAGNSSMNNPFSTASNLLPSAFETEQHHLPQRYNRLPNSTIQKLSSELYNGPLDHSSGQSENGAEQIKTKESPIRQDVVSNAISSSKHAQEDGGPFSACDPTLEPSSVHSESMNSSNVVELSAYSFENPDISLMEFDDYSTVLEQTGSVLHTEVSSTDLDYPRRISKQANEKIESNEFMAFQKWLEECVDVIAD
ncbi:hypothetical protein INT44_008225 [Umbelopsis vinacea]|uniref:DNA 3'-5' helicase n=1 Tax=Umbelopsis vinacea TaxID=44442 RepID=A0A8H7U9V7_9FUNG|nr:hypothetical protein INT44_008225 [Umbelopsis vinacea]